MILRYEYANTGTCALAFWLLLAYSFPLKWLHLFMGFSLLFYGFRCECLSGLCGYPMCEAGSVPQIVSRGDGTPGKCCDVFECVNGTWSFLLHWRGGFYLSVWDAGHLVIFTMLSRSKRNNFLEICSVRGTGRSAEDTYVGNGVICKLSCFFNF